MSINIPELVAPWGSYKNIDTWLKFVAQCADQLQFFLDNDHSPNPEFTRSDLEAYREVLATGDEDVAREFIDTKGAAKYHGRPFADNMAVIAHLKKTGRWPA